MSNRYSGLIGVATFNATPLSWKVAPPQACKSAPIPMEIRAKHSERKISSPKPRNLVCIEQGVGQVFSMHTCIMASKGSAIS